MKTLWNLIQAYPTISALVGYYVLSAAIGSLPAPQPTAGLFYQWFFKFSNTLAGNLTRAFSSKLPVVNNTK
ncbi:MAG: hypothetical protein ACREVZ_00305 [Burkholderiales bacterium]